MDSYFDTIKWIDLGWTIVFQNKTGLLSLKIVFILAGSADPDKMLLSAAFYLGLHCLSK